MRLDIISNLRNSLLIVFGFASLISCHGRLDEWNVPHFGKENVRYTSIYADTLLLDASMTSLVGQWHMADEKILFFDEHVVGAVEYSLTGEYVDHHISEGRGPDEMIEASWISAYDDCLDQYLIQDNGGRLHVFSSGFTRLWGTSRPWFTLFGSDIRGAQFWQELKNHPDPSIPEMYEYNFDCRRAYAEKGVFYFPIVSDHVSYNKYYTLSHSKGYFRDAFTIMAVMAEADHLVPLMIGHYPPKYRNGRLAVFSDYDFFVSEGSIYVAFAADERIYVYGADGVLEYSFGIVEDGISGKYPGTNSFEKYEARKRESKDACGHYDRLSFASGHVFRTCHTDDGQWLLLIYDMKSKDLVGRIPVNGPLDVLGYSNGKYYAYVGEDFKSDCFRLISFSL